MNEEQKRYLFEAGRRSGAQSERIGCAAMVLSWRHPMNLPEGHACDETCRNLDELASAIENRIDDWNKKEKRVKTTANLYHVQDADRPMHVIADDWFDALTAWRELVAEENACTVEDCEPDGISKIADNDDFIIVGEGGSDAN